MAEIDYMEIADEQLDELIIDKDDVEMLERQKDRIQQMFEVQIECGLAASDQVRVKQWITVKGEEEDRKNAKVRMFYTICIFSSEV